MHNLEPFYNWRAYYKSEEDEKSPFFKMVYNEYELSETIYNYYIHPNWDSIGSHTLYVKILYTNYAEGYAIIELFGEWNDCLHNDIMFLKRNVIDELIHHGINKFILIGENILNFHYSDECYYEEWYDELEEGWIILLNFREHVLAEMKKGKIDYYFLIGKNLNSLSWRTYLPTQLFKIVNNWVVRQLP
ncbi:MAG: hypothetical protein BroJett020_19080 [Bacteroidota bacterium]|nr:MAG: hypothetical protein BroJett020_19080 [Bacteroidota bacterium]